MHRAYLGGQQPGQVDLRDHLAATVSLLLVSMLMVLYQMPHLNAALQVRCDHGCAGTQAVRTARVLDHVFCWREKTKTHQMVVPRSSSADKYPVQLFISVPICTKHIAFCCAVLNIGYESFRTYGCLIFYPFLSSMLSLRWTCIRSLWWTQNRTGVRPDEIFMLQPIGRDQP